MSSRVYFEQIIAAAQAGIAALDGITPPEPWQVPEQVIASEGQYLCEPKLIECANGDILCIYRSGMEHVSSTGDAVARRSTDRGVTWGEPFVIHHVDGRDSRNVSASVTPTGRLLVFNRTSIGVTTDKFWRLYSDDNGASWTVDEMFPTQGCIPFGSIVSTSRGLCRMCYLNNKIVAEFSTDNGLTWGNATFPWNSPQNGATLSEPEIVAIDENRLVVVMRNNQSGSHYYYCTSSDGGATWSSLAKATWTATSLTQAAPMSMCLRNGKVWCAWDGRAPLWTGLYSVTDAEEFFAAPYKGWARSVTPAVQKAGHRSVMAVGGTSPGSSYGYSNLLPIEEGVLCAWYDSRTGNGDAQCSIWIEGLSD